MTLDQDLDTITSPILSDGTPVSKLIDVERHEVSMRVLSDPEIYSLELKRLFARAWTVLAHESEIPRTNDFVTRYIGEDNVVVVRDKQNKINVLLNVCTHRGMRICRPDAGNDKQFKCPYHGWTYDPAGRFLGSPMAREQMHGAFRPKEELGLVRARVELYAGFVFATWDPTAPSLDDWLGDIKWYQDLMFDRTDDGLEVLGPPQRFVIPTNWKAPAEQHAGDGYHAMTLHRSLTELAQAESDDSSMYGIDVSANGHGLRCIDQRESAWTILKETTQNAKTLAPLEKLKLMPPPGMTPEMVPQLQKKFDTDQLRVLADFPPSVGGLFPNVGTFSFDFPTPEGMSGVICWHAFVPQGPDKIEFFNWYLVERGATEEVRNLMRRASTLSFGISGFVETDDADTWPQMTKASKGVMGSQGTIKYGALIGENPSFEGIWEDGPWPGGGHVYPGFTKDDSQWQWWLRWRDFMVGEPW
jgi:phenylpropionate dioxygenase-like ring-hydroxylating dioxygenase large terminal subunit